MAREVLWRFYRSDVFRHEVRLGGDLDIDEIDERCDWLTAREDLSGEFTWRLSDENGRDVILSSATTRQR
jgi:hypothetical protein